MSSQLEEETMTINIEEITTKLLNLRAYSKKLSQSFEHETELPDDAVPFLIACVENAYMAYEAANDASRAQAHEILVEWLTRSSRFYLCRVMLSSLAPWTFEFPKTHDFYFT